MDEFEELIRQKEVIRSRLSAWFEAAARELPWRNSGDPYLIYLSEVIMQQTRVDQGTPYFLRFSEAFPRVEILAKAPLDAVLKEWEGLGYYSRARNLHRSAKEIVGRFNGNIPDDLIQLISLPGVGEYTAAAVLSIAFGKAHAVVDGNVIRVLSRLAAFGEEVSSVSARRRLKSLAAELLDPENPGRHNEALMELGAMICRPRNPNCGACPLQKSCFARQRGEIGLYPVKKRRARVPHYEIAVGVISDEDRRFLIQRRAEHGLLGGLWEFPGGKQKLGESIEETCQRELFEELGIHVSVGEALAPVRHAYSHFKITLHAFHCEIVSGEPSSDSGLPLKWVAREQMRDYAFPRANLLLFESLNI